MRDHRVIGSEQELFCVDEEVGSGLILWKPRGAIIRNVLQDFLRQKLDAYGYKQVFTPHIGSLSLYETSGHYPYYKESQFPPMMVECSGCAEVANHPHEAGGYLLKPMNCPHHIAIYRSEHRSYRDLPLRLAEFGTVYRNESKGSLTGLSRVRGFTQDDAHLFCMPEQIEAEISACLELVEEVFSLFEFQFEVKLSLRGDGDKYVGDDQLWDEAEAALRRVLHNRQIEYEKQEGEAAFYGPKIDFLVKDILGRQWQLGTIQLDYNLPERFNLEYANAEGGVSRPVMIHRAPFGSIERFFSILIEQYEGAFPAWLAPEQVCVMPIGEEQIDYAREVHNQLLDAGIRSELNLSDLPLSKKMAIARIKRPPYFVVIGKKEVEAGCIAIRHLKGATDYGQSVESLLKLIKAGDPRC